MKLMSYDQAAKLVAFANAVEASNVKKYLELGAFLTAVANSENTIPAAWLATAICEEGGRDDPTSGYFGIKEWNGFDGYPTAGQRAADSAAGVGGPVHRRTARRTRAMPQLLSKRRTQSNSLSGQFRRGRPATPFRRWR